MTAIEKIPEYQNREILYQKLIEEDKTFEQVASELGCSMTAVRTWSIRLGVPRQEKWKRIKDLHGNEIVSMYKEHSATLQDLAKQFNCVDQTIRRVLEESGVEVRTRSEIKLLRDETFIYRKHDVNENYFETWSSEMAYILGFIAADGCIHTNERVVNGRVKHKSTLKINLQEADREILEKIKNALGYSGDITKHESSGYGKGKGLYHYSLTINSAKIVNDIKEIGIRERKSLDKEMPISLPEEYELDYIRGYFDGNGSVGKQYPKSKRAETKTCQIRVRIVSGSKTNLEQMQSILTKHGFKSKNVSTGKAHRVNVHEICYSTKESIMLYNLFYSNSKSMRMERKYQGFKDCIEQRERDIKTANTFTMF